MTKVHLFNFIFWSIDWIMRKFESSIFTQIKLFRNERKLVLNELQKFGMNKVIAHLFLKWNNSRNMNFMLSPLKSQIKFHVPCDISTFIQFYILTPILNYAYLYMLQVNSYYRVNINEWLNFKNLYFENYYTCYNK